MTSHNDLRVLKAARKILAAKKRWTQGTEARTPDGFTTNARDPNAVCFCAMGAMFKAADDLCLPTPRFYALKQASPDGSIVSFNDRDTTTHKDVRAWFDRAIAQATAVLPDQPPQA